MAYCIEKKNLKRDVTKADKTIHSWKSLRKLAQVPHHQDMFVSRNLIITVNLTVEGMEVGENHRTRTRSGR